MSQSQFSPKAQRQRRLLFLGVILVVIAGGVGLWLAVRDGWTTGSASHAVAPSGSGRDVLKTRKSNGGQKTEVGGSGVDATTVSDSHPSPQSSAGTSRRPLQVLGNGKQTVDERVRQLQGMRGISLSNEERESALSFLSGKEVPEGMGKGSMQWLSDELLTVMRLQDPPWDGLAENLAIAASRASVGTIRSAGGN